MSLFGITLFSDYPTQNFQKPKIHLQSSCDELLNEMSHDILFSKKIMGGSLLCKNYFKSKYGQNVTNYKQKSTCSGIFLKICNIWDSTNDILVQFEVKPPCIYVSKVAKLPPSQNIVQYTLKIFYICICRFNKNVSPGGFKKPTLYSSTLTQKNGTNNMFDITSV